MSKLVSVDVMIQVPDDTDPHDVNDEVREVLVYFLDKDGWEVADTGLYLGDESPGETKEDTG